MELKLFFNAAMGDTVALVSSIGSVALLVLSLTAFWNRPMPRWITIAVAAICFFLAAARVWTEQHRAEMQAEKKLADLTVSDLSGAIYPMSVAPAGDHGQDSFVTAQIDVNNAGAPTIVLNIKYFAVTPNGNRIAGTFVSLGRETKLRGREQPDVILKSEDYFPRKARKSQYHIGAEGEDGLTLYFAALTRGI